MQFESTYQFYIEIYNIELDYAPSPLLTICLWNCQGRPHKRK